MSPVAVSADKRFHRAHVKPARRRGRVRSLAVPVVKLTVALLGLGAVFHQGQRVIADSPMLQVERIVVRGNQRLSSDNVTAMLGGIRGENIVWADLGMWRRRLLASPWVKDASLRRSLPSTVEVTITEREPVAIGRINGSLFLVDDRGSVIDEYGPQYADLDVPIVDGLAARNAPAEAGEDEHADLAARVIAALRNKPEIARRVSQVDVRDLHNAAIILSGDPAVVYVGDERFLARLESYLDVAPALRDRVPNIDYVDLRFDGRIYVRPTDARRR
jgi:cell division protein FtsQ